MCMYRDRDRDRERLRQRVRDLFLWNCRGKSKIYRAGQKPGDSGKSRCCSSRPKAVFWQNSLFLGDFSLFSLKTFN